MQNELITQVFLWGMLTGLGVSGILTIAGYIITNILTHK